MIIGIIKIKKKKLKDMKIKKFNELNENYEKKQLDETASDLIDKYGSKIALIVVDEIIKEYDENICYCGYDYDHDMWNSQKEEWIKVKSKIEELTQ
jgi:hypothetical protein